MARKTNDIDLSLYDTVIIGSPVWWYTIAPPVRSLLSSGYLKDKDVYFYATNAGWLGSTFEEAREFCNIKDTLSIKYNTDGEKIITSISDINAWIDKIKGGK